MGIIPAEREKGFYLWSWEISPQIPSGSSSGEAPNPKREKQEKSQKNRGKKPQRTREKSQKKGKEPQKKGKVEFIPSPHAALQGFLAPNSQNTPWIKRQKIRDQALNPSRGAGNTPIPSHMEFSWI